MLLQACKLDLLPRTPSQVVSSLLFEASSSSVALMLSDSSFLLYPFLSPFSRSLAAPPIPTPIPPVSTAACFVRLCPASNSDPGGRILFLSAAPGSSTIVLRAWILCRRARAPATGFFAPARLSFKRDLDRSVLALQLCHGISVRLAGSVNIIVLHSLAANQIWVLAARIAGEDGGRVSVRLTKCAVIDCMLPIYSVGLSMGFLLLGEVGGVRVFPLRPLTKGGRAVRQKGLSAVQSIGSVAVSKKKVLNGVVFHVSRAKSELSATASGEPPGHRVPCCNGECVRDKGIAQGRMDADNAPCKLRTAKLKQDSGDYCSFFLGMRCADVQNSESGTGASTSVKAVTIHVLSQKKFLILDSVGDVHLLNLHNTVIASEGTGHSPITSKDAYIKRLSYTMKVQMLAVLPDISTRTQVIWISGGGYSVHMMSVADMESPINENDRVESEEKTMQISAIQAMFTSEKVKDIVPLSANVFLILGQGNIFAYAIA